MKLFLPVSSVYKLLAKEENCGFLELKMALLVLDVFSSFCFHGQSSSDFEVFWMYALSGRSVVMGNEHFRRVTLKWGTQVRFIGALLVLGSYRIDKNQRGNVELTSGLVFVLGIGFVVQLLLRKTPF